MNADELPGKPLQITLRCPVCGWGFDLGFREMGELQIEGGEDRHRGITCCSKCLTTLEFNMDGSDVVVLTPDMIAALPPAQRHVIRVGYFVAWLAQRYEAPLQ